MSLLVYTRTHDMRHEPQIILTFDTYQENCFVNERFYPSIFDYIHRNFETQSILVTFNRLIFKYNHSLTVHYSKKAERKIDFENRKLFGFFQACQVKTRALLLHYRR